MIQGLAKSLFGSRNDRLIKQMQKTVKQINALEPEMQKCSDQDLKSKTDLFKQRLSQGEKLNHILPEAFAVVREASVRTLGMRHYDVQLMGGIVLHQGKIAEMHTGEGKTLVATLPLYLNALLGKGAHLVTVNDYLAQRDAELMGAIYTFLGLTVGVIVADMDPEARKSAYNSDITYGTNNEFGFDYLRDNMAFSLEERVQRPLNYAVVDEVDSILIDEARTPLLISGPAENSSELYSKLVQIMPQLDRAESEEEGAVGDYVLDEKTKQAHLTDAGHQKLESLLVKAGILEKDDSLYSPQNISLMHYVSASLRACTLFHKDIDYMVKDGEILIVDEHTGRAMAGRRWSDGLHQAVEAKEKVSVQGENQTMASITYQNFFRLYNKLAGMTGTADTEAFEFNKTYGLEVVIIPTHKPMIRKDHSDYVFLTQTEKNNAIVKDIQNAINKGQPVLVGTASIESSEILSKLLKKSKIKHSVLNAKQHEKEAHIVAQAGQPGAVTIATNMAGRGTDIILGGNFQAEIDGLKNPSQAKIDKIKSDWKERHDKVISAGGLHILGSERHESRRIDNQLRGRSGRQGDPGSSRFFLSLEDNLVRIFVSDRMASMMSKMGMGDGEPLESKMVSRQIAKAQKKVESHHYDVRKELLEYDDVSNDQRLVIYDQRKYLLENHPEDFQGMLKDMQFEVVSNLVYSYIPEGSVEEQWDIDGLQRALKQDFGLDFSVENYLNQIDSENQESVHDSSSLIEELIKSLDQVLEIKIGAAGQNEFEQYIKNVLLMSLDQHWREHLNNLDHLRQSIGLRGYAQKDPKQEYKREAYLAFKAMLDEFHYEVISAIAKVEVKSPEDINFNSNSNSNSNSGAQNNYQYNYYDSDLSGLGADNIENNLYKGVGRNDPCPCGSGKKFKRCHGVLK